MDYAWEPGWSDWVQLGSLQLNDIPKGAGAYLVAVDTPLSRARGTDAEGILTIGESGALSKRIGRFRSCAAGHHDGGHIAGWRYREMNFASHFPLDSLWVRWIGLAGKPEAQSMEARLLRTYMDQHLDTPPLNFKFSWFQRDGVE